MRPAVLPLALLIAATPAQTQMRSQPAPGVGAHISINGAPQASLADRRQYLDRPYVVVRGEGWRGELRQLDRRIRGPARRANSPAVRRGRCAGRWP